MTVNLPMHLESLLRAEVNIGRFASMDEAIAEAVRLLLEHREAEQPDCNQAEETIQAGLGSIGAMRDAADELDEIVADAMRRRRLEARLESSLE